METDSASEGRCISCGFLAKFDLHYSGPPPYIYEMPPRDRETGERSGLRLEAAREITGFPQCYVNASDIWKEIGTARRDRNIDEFSATRQVLDQDRHCSKWYPYTQGYSPQEHLEEKRVLQLEKDRKEFEFRIEQDRKNFELLLEQRNRNFQIFLAIVVAILAVAEIIASLLQVVYPNGWPWLQKLLHLQEAIKS